MADTPILFPLLPGRGSPGSAYNGLPGEPLGIEQSWRQVHELLANRCEKASTIAELGGLSVYYYFVHQSFNEEPDASRARQLFRQLVCQLVLADANGQLDHACTAAWLNTRLRASGGSLAVPDLLADLDQQMHQRTHELQHAPRTGSRGHLLRILRYFSLRTPAALVPSTWRTLLLPATAPAGPMLLGLDKGLTAELMALIRLHQAGLHDTNIQEQVRQGVRHLLATRRSVDFVKQQFAVFPYQVQSPNGDRLFDAELSWRRGDLGPAWLLYEAHNLLEDAELARIAELVGLNTLLRTSHPATQIASSQFYRGAAGLAHLYSKFYHTSGQQPAYYQGHLFWLNQTQYWLQQELTVFPHPPYGGDLLHGLGGVGLVLLAAVTGTVSDWDEVLL